MKLTRRTLLQTLTASIAVRAVSAAMGSRPERWRTALAVPRSQCFGLGPGGQPRDPESLYRLATPGGAPLSFDISNNRIACSLSTSGELSRVCISTGVTPLPAAKLQGGVYSTKTLVRGGPWTFAIQADDAPLTAAACPQVDLLGDVIPLFTWERDGLQVRQVAFAPIDTGPIETGNVPLSPRAILVVFHLHNQRPRDVVVTISPPQVSVTAASAADAPGEGAGPDAAADWLAFASTRVRVAPGADAVVEVAMLLEESREAAAHLRRLVEQRTAIDWFEDTLRYHRARYGTIAIEAAPAIAESIPRFAETCRQSVLCSEPGVIDGGFLGSDVDARGITWNRDTFYNVLASSLFAPQLCASAVPFFLQWGLPPQPTPRGLARFPAAGAVTQSLGNAVAPLALAAAYYRFTGDRQVFRRWPRFLQEATARLEAVLATKRGDVFLFPSMFISNGDARGHHHTGSNVLAWYAFDGMARLAREVYGDEGLHARWSGTARQVRAGILERCTGIGPRGRQFFEGVFDDHTYVPGHDGEESDTTLMPCYGFCDADEPMLLRHAALGLTPMNPYYADGLDAIWWHNHGGFRPATMPGWMTALASASTEREVEARLQRIRQVTDLDGSLWWWPYRYGETDRAAVLRGQGAAKCGWASAVYLLRMVQVVLGLDVDVPAQRLRFRPFCPWPRVAWRDCRLGAGLFDVSYDRPGLGGARGAASAVSAEIRNRNAGPFEIRIELRVPDRARVVGCEVNGVPTETPRGRYFEGETIQVTRTVPAGDRLRVRCTTA